MNEHPFDWRSLYLALAAAAGSVVALHSMEWQKMSWSEIGLTLFSGFAVAIFAMPYIADTWMGLDMTDPRNACGVTFIGGTLWNSIMPLVTRKVRQAFGAEEKSA